MSLLRTTLLLSLLVVPVVELNASTTTAVLHQDDQVKALVARGLELMREGKLEDAVNTLKNADAQDGGELRTRMWLIRAMIERNHLNDALDLTDELSSAGNTGPDMDYLYGMSFVYKARKYISEGVNLGTVGMHFTDAVTYLSNATQADATKYADAFLPLAEAAWNSQDLVVARTAAESAARLEPNNVEAAIMLGEVSFSQFVASNGNEATQAEADAHWQVAVDAFESASKIEGAHASRLALAFKKAGDAYVWKSKLDEAGKSYSEAMAQDPAQVDFGQVLNSLQADPFLVCIEAGAAGFTKRHGKRTEADATLQWWLGWSRYTHQDYPKASEAFDAAYKKWPAYTNCKWYMGLCAYYQQDYDTALALILENFDLGPADVGGSINGDAGRNVRLIEFLIGRCVNDGANLKAAKLCEALAISSPNTSRFWNNAGLFYRDTADIMGRSRGEVDVVEQRKLYEKSLVCYETALSLEPQNPNYLNDTAVLLHYNLDRDLERALELYKQSYASAVKELERTDLDADTLAAIRIAHRDSKNNQRLVESELEKRRKAREKAEQEAEKKRLEEEARKKREEEAGQGSGDGR